ncbi:M28 family peptidase [Acidipila rosea]|nr:M28 family peptidase [Acidipila rosea]
MVRRGAWLIVLMSALYAHAAQPSGSLFFWNIPRQKVTAHLRSVPLRNSERRARLKQLFLEEECPGENLKEHDDNLWCVLPGKDDLTLIVAAHYDRRGAGVGAIDDWSGAVMVPLLYKSLTAQSQPHTILFVELAGDKGAARFLSRLGKAERRRIAAFVDLEALGLGNTAYFANPNAGGDRLNFAEYHLIQLTYASARVLGEPVLPDHFDSRLGLKHDLTQRFRWSDIPSITMHSISRETQKIPGSELDTPEMLQDQSYFQSYRLLCAYVAYTTFLLDKLAMDDPIWHTRVH